jgi:predicted nicotinamide N-methyase
MTHPTPGALRAFVRRTTRLLPVADLPEVRLHQASDVTVTWHLAGTLLGLVDPPLPYWAFPWAGGLAVARYLADHPAEVAGRRVLDLASGSGICGIVAARLGAAEVVAADVDPLAVAATGVNARANGVHIAVTARDLLSGPSPDVDVVLAGDVFYEETMAARMAAWLRDAAAAGIRVLAGDPGRRFVPAGLAALAVYEVRTSRELEKAEVTRSTVLTFGAAGAEPQPTS